MVETSIPDEALRRAALTFLAAAIENADEERSDRGVSATPARDFAS